MIYHRCSPLFPLWALGGAVLVSALLWSAHAQAAPPLPHNQPGGATPTASLTPGCPLAWGLVVSPNVGQSNMLNAVAAFAANDVWAVGRESHINGGTTLVEHWNGANWSIIPSPPGPGWYNELRGIGALAPNDIWAVGHGSAGGQHEWTVVEHWDGSQWSLIPSPNPQAEAGYLVGVAPLAANDVWAVGYHWKSGQGAWSTLIEHWNGASWSIVPSPNGSTIDNYLFGVTAVAVNDVWAVGTTSVRTLVLHWDGLSWSIVPSPNPSANLNALRSAAAVTANDIWAVGNYPNGGAGYQTLTEHWDGAQWTVFPSPNVGATYNNLYAVTARATDDAWAVGEFRDAANTLRTLILHWDGSQWSVVPSPNGAPGNNGLHGVAVVAPDDGWAVGFSQDSTLSEHYSRACFTVTPTPTITPTPTFTPPCPPLYTDVPPDNPFYPYIRCLSCRGIVGGYTASPPCTTGVPCFQPNAEVTRGQLAKILAGAAGFVQIIPSTRQTFADVSNSNPFWLFVERLYAVGVISGYDCGGPGEPCDAQNRPYFRWGALANRGQVAKIDEILAGYLGVIPSTQWTFHDVPNTNPFWRYIEMLADHGILSGYDCGGPSEPCDARNRPYFRWGNLSTRAQLAKIAANTFFPNCSTP